MRHIVPLTEASSVPAGVFVRFGDGTDDPAGVAHGHRIAGDVLDHHTAAADDDIIADSHAWHHLYTCAEPDVVSHRDGVGIFKALIAALKVDGVACRVESAVRSDKNIVTEGHVPAVEDDEVVVGIEVFTHTDVIAVITPEGGCDIDVFPHLPEKLVKDLLLPGSVGGVELIVRPAQLFCPGTLCQQFAVIVCIVEHVMQHLFFFGHGKAPFSK